MKKENLITRSLIMTKEDEERRSSSLTRLARPQTRVVMRPTTDIKHPIIPSTPDLPRKDKRNQKENTNLRRTNSINLASTAFKIKDERDNKKPYQEKSPIKVKKISTNNHLDDSCDLTQFVDAPKVTGTSFRRRARTAIRRPESLKPPVEEPAGWRDFQSKLSVCPQCKRHFFPYRLKSHLKFCDEVREESLEKSLEPESKESSQGSTVGIQEPKSESRARKLITLFHRNKKPLDESSPESPLKSTPSLPPKTACMEYSSREYEEIMKKMKRCQKCNRTFFPERLATHEAHCLSIAIKPFFLR